MSILDGQDVTLHIGDAQLIYHRWDSMDVLDTAMIAPAVATNHVSASGWQQHLSHAGQRRLSVTAEGYVSTAIADTLIEQYALSAESFTLQIHHLSGYIIQADAVITSYQQRFDQQSLARYQCSLRSTGALRECSVNCVTS